RTAWLFVVAVAVLTFIAFVPALQGEFLGWDDAKNFVENPHYRGLGPTQLAWMWTTFRLGHYVPLSWMTLGLDYVLWGMNPVGYHVTSLVLHAANAVLVFLLATQLVSLARRREGESAIITPEVRWAAAFAALVFAVHPLRVESVAWITERRDMLSLFFYLASVLAYLAYRTRPGSPPRW